MFNVMFLSTDASVIKYLMFIDKCILQRIFMDVNNFLMFFVKFFVLALNNVEQTLNRR